MRQWIVNSPVMALRPHRPASVDPVVIKSLKSIGLLTSFIAASTGTAMCMDEVDEFIHSLFPVGSQDENEEHSSGEEDDDDDEGEVDDEQHERGDDLEHGHELAALRVGEPARHDFLGMGTVLAIGSTKEVADGVLRGDATFESLGLTPDKVRFKFMKKERVPGRGPARYKDIETIRNVTADALQRVAREAGGSGEEEQESPGGAFATMAEAATTPHAFTHGFDAPALAAHERKRKLHALKDAKVRGRNRKGRTTKEPNIAPEARIAEFPSDSLFKNEKGQLHCKACGLELSLRLGSLRSHLNSAAHKQKHKAHVESLVDDGDLTGWVTRHFEQNADAQGHTLPSDVHVYRWRVVESFMFAGIPLAKTDMLRHLLERANYPLTHSSHLGQDYIPLIEEREIKRVVKELLKQHFSLIFDGTTRLGEAINMVTRFITDDFQIRQRLVAFKTLAKHTDGDGLCRLILKTLQQELGLDLDYCVAYARDSCATNGVATRGLLLHSVYAASILCFSHTLHNSGKHLNLPVIDEFMTGWLQLVMQPGAAKSRWKGIIGTEVASYSKVRWWSRFEIMEEIATNFGEIPDFIRSLEDDDIGDATTLKMATILASQRDELELELAAVMCCKRLRDATYRLEGDQLELLLTYQTIEALRNFGATLGKDASDLPSVASLLRKRHKIANGTEVYEWYEAPHSKWFQGKVTRMPTIAKPTYQITYSDNTTIEHEERDLRNWIDVRKFPEWKTAVACVKKAYAYLEDRITDNCTAPYHCSASYEVCRVSQLFDPSFATANVTLAFVDELCAAIPAFAGKAAALKAEVEVYRVAARTAPPIDHGDVKAFTEALLTFWSTQGKKMPTWREAAKIVFAIPPSSAASERVFSLLKAMFGEAQDSSLADVIQAALMLRYNKRSVG